MEYIKNYIDKGYKNNIIAEKLNKDISDINFIVNYIAKNRLIKEIEIKMLSKIMLTNLV